MTLIQLKKKYKITKFQDRYLLFSKTEHGKRLTQKYIWYIIKNNDRSYSVEGMPGTQSIAKLEKQIEDKIKSLPYDPEYYMPRWNIGLFEEFIIIDWLKTLGFEYSGNDFFLLKNKDIYGFNSSEIAIKINGLEPNIKVEKNKWIDTLKEEVDIWVYKGNFNWHWVSSNCKRDIEEIKQNISNLIKPLLVTESVISFQLSEKLNDIDDINIYLNALLDNSKLESIDFKQTLKKKLLEMAESI